MTMVKKKQVRKPQSEVLPVRVETRLKHSEMLDLDKAKKTFGLSRNQVLRQAFLEYVAGLKQSGVL